MQILKVTRRLPRRPRRAEASLRDRGFTLLELMVTVTVAAILLTAGVPGFSSFIQNNRATTHTNDLVNALNLGRSEAIRRGAAVLVCSSSDGATCSDSNDWSSGWVVITPSGQLIRSWPERTGGTGVLAGNVTEMRFQPRGSVAAAGAMQVRMPGCTGSQGRDVAVNAPGRVSVARVDC